MGQETEEKEIQYKIIFKKIETKDLILTICMASITMIAFAWGFDKFIVWKYHLQTAYAPCEMCIQINPQLPDLKYCFLEATRRSAFPNIFNFTNETQAPAKLLYTTESKIFNELPHLDSSFNAS